MDSNNNFLTTFNFNDANPVRTVTINNEPWFVARDVCDTLGYANPRDAIQRHCRGAVVKRDAIDALGRTQETTIISERDLYRLIMRSRLPSAEQFEDWVVGTVLPAIRKTGGYIAGEETMTDDEIMSRALEIAQAKIAAKDAQLAAQAPAVLAQELLGASEGSFTLSDAARRLNMAQRTFLAWLNDNGWTFTMRGKANGNRRVPYADKRADGLMEVVTKTGRFNLTEVTTHSTYITAKGLAKLSEILGRT